MAKAQSSAVAEAIRVEDAQGSESELGVRAGLRVRVGVRAMPGWLRNHLLVTCIIVICALSRTPDGRPESYF